VDWNREVAEARGIDVSSVVTVVDVVAPHDGDGLTVQPEISPQERLLAFLKANPGAEQATIKKSVKARWQEVRRSLTELFQKGQVKRDGAGTRNSGYRYSVQDGNKQ
jgi:hypothetical protein